MRTLRDLLATWENWCAQDVRRRALEHTATETQREVMREALARGVDVDPLAALRDEAELVAALAGWRWQVVQSARERGATWTEIGAAIGMTADRAEGDHVETIERQYHRRSGSSRQ